MKRKCGKMNQLFYFQVRESPAPLKIPIPTSASYRGGPVACIAGPVACIPYGIHGIPTDFKASVDAMDIWDFQSLHPMQGIHDRIEHLGTSWKS